MTDAVEVAVESALLARATQFANNNSLTIALPNIEFIAPTSTKTAKYLRASFMPVPTLGLGVNSNSHNQHYGILQIDVLYGQGGGEIAPGRIASDIIGYFKFGTSLSQNGFTIQIWKPPYRSIAMSKDGDPWLMIAVSIPYVCFASNPA